MSLIKAKSGVLAFAIGLGLAFGVLADAKAQSKPLVSDIRAAENGERTRFVLSLDRRIAFTVFPLADPYRVVIDLPEVGWQLPSRPLPAGVGLMERLRYGLFQPGTTRVVLDMKGPVAVERAFWLDPDDQGRHRLVVDIGRISRDAMIAGLREGAVKSEPGKSEKAAAESSARVAALSPPPAPNSNSKSKPAPARLPAAGGDTGEDGASAKTSVQEAATPMTPPEPDLASPAVAGFAKAGVA
ncbi:MAG: AMIN domain-containing protein, partial [Pseudomonadota bacterium]